MSNINKQAREKLKLAAAKAVDNFDPNMFVETRDVLALLDELEAAEKRLSEILKPNILLPVIDGMDEYQLRRVIKNCTENYSLLHSKWEAAEKRIAELGEVQELFLRAKALMYQSGGLPIDRSLNPIDAWLYDAECAAGISTRVEE